MFSLLRRTLVLCSVMLCGFRSEPTLEEKIKTLSDHYVNQNNNYGVAIGIIDGDKVIRLCNSRTGCNETIDSSTIFEIGSISKLFTSLLLAEEVEGKSLQLQQPISSFLPSTAHPSFASITFEQLASHSSGLPRLADNFWSRVNEPENPYRDYSEADLNNYISQYSLKQAPGQHYAYSNFGAGLLGNIIVNMHHTSYEALIKEKICSPFGMKETFVKLDPKGKFSTPHAGGKPSRYWDFQDATAGQGAIKSDLSDMTRFLQYNLYPEQSPFPSALQLMQEIHFSDPSQNKHTGLGWHIGSFNGQKYLEHNGATGGFRSYIGMIPGKKLGIVILSNSDNSVDDLGIDILRLLDAQKITETVVKN